MGSISRTGDGRYRLRVELTADPETGKRRWHSEPCRGTRKRCKERLAKLEADPAEIGSREPLRVYLSERWLPHYAATFRASSYRQRRVVAERWLLPELGDEPLGRIDAARVERALAAWRRGGASAKRCATVLAVLKAALAQAVRWGLLGKNPAAGVRAPAAEATERNAPWTAAQFAAFLAGQEGVWRCLWLLLAGTGMRVAEARALRWADVDFARPAVAVRRTWARGDGGEYLSVPKSAAGRRLVVVGPALAAELRRWQTEQAAAYAAVGWPVDPDDGLVVARGDGSPLPAPTVDKRFAAASAGLPKNTIHGLRHLAVTEQLVAGVPLKVVSARIGHSSLRLTADLYGHVGVEHQTAAAAVLDTLVPEVARDGGVSGSALCAPDVLGGGGGEAAGAAG